jgi:hypothetical protein
MTQQFENFVNAALDKSLASDVTLPTADDIPVFTGIGRQVTGKTTSRIRISTGTEKSKLDAITGTNTGDETQASIKTKLGVASTDADGYLTSTDWNTFNGKLGLLVIV